MALDRITDEKEILPNLALSEESFKVLQIALEEAQKIGKEFFIDTADLLVGLIQVGDVGKVLRDSGITVESVRKAKEELGGYDYVPPNRQPNAPSAIQVWSQIPRTERMHKIGRWLTRKAILDGKRVIEPRDILGVIIEERDGLGARVLRHLHLEPKKFFLHLRSGT